MQEQLRTGFKQFLRINVMMIMRNKILFSLITAVLHSSTADVTSEETPQALSAVTFDPSTQAELCSNLKSHKQHFRMHEFMKIINDMWDRLYPKDPEAAPGTRIESRVTCQEHLNKMLQNCGIQTALHIEIMRGLDPVGVLDLRTIEGSNTTQMVAKHRFQKPSCGVLDGMLACLQAESFKAMYPNDVKVIALVFSFSFKTKDVISDWIALLYHNGDIIDAQERARCLRAKEFLHLQFKDKWIGEYFPDSNATTPVANETTPAANETTPAA